MDGAAATSPRPCGVSPRETTLPYLIRQWLRSEPVTRRRPASNPQLYGCGRLARAADGKTPTAAADAGILSKDGWVVWRWISMEARVGGPGVSASRRALRSRMSRLRAPTVPLN